jgi:hypothetical protein
MDKRFGLPTNQPEVINWGPDGLVVGDSEYQFKLHQGVIWVFGPNNSRQMTNAPTLSFSPWQGDGDPVVHVGPLELLSLHASDLLLPWTFEQLFRGDGRYGTRDMRIAIMNTTCGLRGAISARFDRTVWLCVRSTHTFTVDNDNRHRS